jgi:hypothetical protein
MSGRERSCAVVIDASGGIGGALEAALIEEGAFDFLHGLARSRGGAQHIDLLNEASIAAVAAQVGKGPAPTLILVATGLARSSESKSRQTFARAIPLRFSSAMAPVTRWPTGPQAWSGEVKPTVRARLAMRVRMGGL